MTPHFLHFLPSILSVGRNAVGPRKGHGWGVGGEERVYLELMRVHVQLLLGRTSRTNRYCYSSF